MTITYKTTFQQAQEMFAAAATQGPTAIDTHLRALAFSLGAQAVFGTHPEAMPDVVNDLVTEFGNGVKTAMQEAYGIQPSTDGVEIHAVNVTKH